MVPSPEPPSRTSRRKDEARRRLLAAAGELIAEKGVDGLRLRELTDRADIGFGSFYTHYADKEELVAAVVTDTVEHLSSTVIAHAATIPDPAEAVAVAQRWFTRLATSDPALARLIHALGHPDALFVEMLEEPSRAAIHRGVEQGRFAPIDVDVVTSIFVGGTLTVMRNVLDGRFDGDADEATAEAVLRTLGIAPDEAREIARRPYPDAPPA
ncbi:MAG: TetR/AcrR family transcriptional regulator [Solirubrobacteraceae bacterium]|nr:TetR/AcrR family transcriptional regulator [Solirubrobacteraceae bacterium]